MGGEVEPVNSTKRKSGKLEGGFNATERGVYAASTWKNERFRISHVAMNFEREAA